MLVVVANFSEWLDACAIIEFYICPSEVVKLHGTFVLRCISRGRSQSAKGRITSKKSNCCNQSFISKYLYVLLIIGARPLTW